MLNVPGTEYSVFYGRRAAAHCNNVQIKDSVVPSTQRHSTGLSLRSCRPFHHPLSERWGGREADLLGTAPVVPPRPPALFPPQPPPCCQPPCQHHFDQRCQLPLLPLSRPPRTKGQRSLTPCLVEKRECFLMRDIRSCHLE